jgi:hypothetical protein
VRPAEADIGALLELLHAGGVDCIVVGGAAALLHGAPIATVDLDIVPEQGAANLDRLFALFAGLDAILREPGSRQLSPGRQALDGTGQLLLRTRLGPLDVLLRLHDGSGYPELVAHTVVRSVGDFHVRLIDLPTLAAVKGSTGRARDRLTVPLLLDLMKAESEER